MRRCHGIIHSDTASIGYVHSYKQITQLVSSSCTTHVFVQLNAFMNVYAPPPWLLTQQRVLSEWNIILFVSVKRSDPESVGFPQNSPAEHAGHGPGVHEQRSASHHGQGKSSSYGMMTWLLKGFYHCSASHVCVSLIYRPAMSPWIKSSSPTLSEVRWSNSVFFLS